MSSRVVANGQGEGPVLGMRGLGSPGSPAGFLRDGQAQNWGQTCFPPSLTPESTLPQDLGSPACPLALGDPQSLAGP